MSNGQTQSPAENLPLRDAYYCTYEADEVLIKLVGNLTLRDVSLTQAERTLLDAAILKLAEVRTALLTVDPTIRLG